MSTTAPTTAPPFTADELAGIRADFPLLSVARGGTPLAYLDSGATSQKPRPVLDAERRYLETGNAAVHRGAHTLAAEATELFESARERVAAFIGARPDEIVWTSGATAALNTAARAIGEAAPGSPLAIGPGDEIVATELEHHANLIPWQELARRTGATFRYVPVRADGTLDAGAIDDVVTERTRVLAFSHLSNVIGTLSPVPAFVAAARRVGATVVVDACQSVPHLPVDVRELGADLLAFSGHKMLGPTGVGVLWGRAEVLAELPPVTTGGSMITTVTMERAEFLPPPQRFEAGTQPVSQAIALGAAIDYLDGIGMDRIAAHERALGAAMVEGLRGIPGVRVLGPNGDVASAEHDPGERGGTAAFVLEGVHSHDLGQFLDDRGVAVRVGHHCAQPLHRALGIVSSTRASAYLYTSSEEVERMLTAVADAARFFGRAA